MKKWGFGDLGTSAIENLSAIQFHGSDVFVKQDAGNAQFNVYSASLPSFTSLNNEHDKLPSAVLKETDWKMVVHENVPKDVLASFERKENYYTDALSR